MTFISPKGGHYDGFEPRKFAGAVRRHLRTLLHVRWTPAGGSIRPLAEPTCSGGRYGRGSSYRSTRQRIPSLFRGSRDHSHDYGPDENVSPLVHPAKQLGPCQRALLFLFPKSSYAVGIGRGEDGGETIENPNNSEWARLKFSAQFKRVKEDKNKSKCAYG